MTCCRTWDEHAHTRTRIATPTTFIRMAISPSSQHVVYFTLLTRWWFNFQYTTQSLESARGRRHVNTTFIRCIQDDWGDLWAHTEERTSPPVFFFPQEKHDDDSIKTNCRVHYIPFFVVVVGIHQLIPPETLDRVPIFPTRYDGVCVCAPFLVTRNLIIAPVTKFYQHTLCAGWAAAAAAVDPHKEYKPVSGNTFLSKTRYIGWLFARSHSHGPALDAYSLSGWINVSSGKWRNEMIGYIFMKLTWRTSQGKSRKEIIFWKCACTPVYKLCISQKEMNAALMNTNDAADVLSRL